MFWAALIPLLKAAGIGAAIGGGTAAVTGGDVKKGALMGAAGGGIGSGLTGLMGGASGGVAGTGASQAAANAGVGAASAGAPSGVAGGLGSVGAQTAAKTATKAGFNSLLKKAATDAAVNTATGAALDAVTPKHGMTTPGNVPQMQQAEDVMAAIQQLMEKSKQRRAI